MLFENLANFELKRQHHAYLRQHYAYLRQLHACLRQLQVCLRHFIIYGTELYLK